MRFGTSQAARWQAYQTRARIGATLWKILIKASAVIWVGATLAVIWIEIGRHLPQLGHAYFCRWAIASTVNDIPYVRIAAARGKIPLDGAWYAWREAVDWLNGPQAYGHTFPAYFAHYGKWTGLVIISIWMLVGLMSIIHGREDEHIRGLRLIPRRNHNAQLNGGFLGRAWCAVRGNRAPTGINIGRSRIPFKMEPEHFLVTGSPGAGKSTLMRQMLYQLQERRQPAVVLDPDCEFVQEFYNEARGDVVLNPLDARCPFWSPWLEFRDDSFAMDAEALAASLIRGIARSATERFFQDSSRTLLESMFHAARQGDTAGSQGLIEFMEMTRQEMHSALQGTRAYPLIDPDARETGTGIVAGAANAIKSFYHLPGRDQTSRTWSARQWAQSRKGWVFLSSTEDGRAATQTLQGVWLDSLVRWLMSNHIGTEQCWIIADEFPALDHQPQVEKVIVRGRKRGICVVIGFQNVSQLRTIYGHDGAITLTSSPTTKVILRSDESDTAKWASDLLGSHEIERLNMTALTGMSSYREGLNLSPQRATDRIVTASEIQMLRPLEGFLCVAGHNRTRIQIPELHLTARQPPFVPRGATINNEPQHINARGLRKWN